MAAPRLAFRGGAGGDAVLRRFASAFRRVGFRARRLGLDDQIAKPVLLAETARGGGRRFGAPE